VSARRAATIVLAVQRRWGGKSIPIALKNGRGKRSRRADGGTNPYELNNLDLSPGDFSTAEVWSDLSGRGVRQDVVRRNIQDLGGRIKLSPSRPRHGHELGLPLTWRAWTGGIVRVVQEDIRDADLGDRGMNSSGSTDNSPLVGTCGLANSREHVPLVYWAII